MKNKDRIKELTELIKIIESEAVGLQAEAFSLRTERELLVAKIILEEGLLINSTWEFFLSDSSAIYLIWKSDGQMDMVTELAKMDYHSWFDLSDGIRLQLDSDELTLSFQDSKQVMPFVKKHKINVVGTKITDHLSKLKREVSALEAICHQFNI